jgi:hypothetical protein
VAERGRGLDAGWIVAAPLLALRRVDSGKAEFKGFNDKPLAWKYPLERESGRSKRLKWPTYASGCGRRRLEAYADELDTEAADFPR